MRSPIRGFFSLLYNRKGNSRKTVAGVHLVTCGLVLGVSGCLMACEPAPVQEQKVTSIRVGISVYDQYDTFISQVSESFREAATDKEGETGVSIRVEYGNAARSQEAQNEQVANMVEDGCDVICVNLVDRTEPTTIIDLAEKNNIPIIFFNRELVEEDLERWDRLYYVGAKAFESGTMQGELAAEYYRNHPEIDRNGDGKLQYVMLEGEAGHQDAIVRTEYSVNAIMTAGIIPEKLGYAIANWNRSQAQTKMVQFINAYGKDVELVLANNDDMALGAVDAYYSMDIPENDWPAIFGIDGTKVGMEALEKGDIQGTVYNDSVGQAQKMLELAYRLSIGESLQDLNLERDKYLRLPYQKIGQAAKTK